MPTKDDSNMMTFTTPSDREGAFTRRFDAPRELIFDAWTRPMHISRWMLGPEGWAMPVCEADLRSGGTWHFVWRRSDGTEMGMRGTYLEVAPPERLVSTEEWGGGWPETRNTLVLTEEGGGTVISLTILYPSKEARDAALQTGMREGMSLSFRRLDEYLRSL